MKKLTVYNDANGSPAFALEASDDCNALVLVAATAQSIAVPSGARFAAFSPTCNFWCLLDGTPAVPSASVTDGTAPTLNPGVLALEDATNIGIVTDSAGFLGISFYA
jgi:hypothetical protein